METFGFGTVQAGMTLVKLLDRKEQLVTLEQMALQAHKVELVLQEIMARLVQMAQQAQLEKLAQQELRA
jgi:hypothetical protein